MVPAVDRHPRSREVRRAGGGLPAALVHPVGAATAAGRPARALQAVGDSFMASTSCLGDMFMPNRDESYKVSSKIEAITFNTKDRAMRYIAYNKARSGSVTSYPKGNACK